MGWNRFSWLDHLALPVVSAAMRAAWIVPWVNAILASVFVEPRGLELPFWSVMLMLLGGSAFAHTLSRAPLGRVITALVGVLALGAFMQLLLPIPAQTVLGWLREVQRQALDWSVAMPAVWIVFLVGAGLWMRAISIDWTEPRPLQRGFVTGTIAIALLMIAGGHRYGVSGGTDILAAMALFVAAGLSAMSLTGLSQTLRQSARLTGVSQRVGRYWYLVVAMTAGAVLLAAALIALVVDPGMLRAIMGWFSPVVQVLANVLGYVIMAVAYVIFQLLGPLMNWIRNLRSQGQESEPLQGTPEPSADPTTLGEPQGTFSLPPWTGTAVLVLIALVALVLFVLYMRKRFVSFQDGVLETREVDWSWGQMRDQLRDWFRPRLNLRRTDFLSLGESNDPRQVIRGLYQRMLRLMAERGLFHTRTQTPAGFARMVGKAVPPLSDALQRLTALYEAARYSRGNMGEAEVANAQEALAEIEAILADYDADSTGSAMGSDSPG